MSSETPPVETPVETPPVETPPVVEPPAASYDFAKMRASLPAELRDNPILDPYSSGETPSGFEGLVRSHVDVQKLVGGEKVTKPGKDATPEDMARYYNALGRPETAEGYDLGDFAPPQGMPWDPNLQTNMVEDMHASGLSNEQVNGVIRAFAKHQGEAWMQAQVAVAQGREDSEKALRAELGDGYDGAIEMGGRAALAGFGPELLKEVENIPLADGTLLGNHPAMNKAFIEIGKQMGEHGMFADKTSTAGALMSPAEAQAELEIMEHPGSETSKAIVTKSHPDHKIVKAKWRMLNAIANPETPAA